MDPVQFASEPSPSPFARMQKLLQSRRKLERCELCGSTIPPQHQHLLDMSNRQLMCSCEACAILFSGDAHQRYRRVPHRAELLSELKMSEEIWESLHIPINLAFFYHSSQAGKVIAMYPGPAGVTESLLPTDAWRELTSISPALSKMKSDVEALLVNHLASHNECFLVSIDECYKLTGLLRANWRGLSGGQDVWREIKDFFDELRRRGDKTGGNGGA